MKKEILLLAALMMAAACEITKIPDAETSGGNMTLFFTGEKPVMESDTKTYYDPVSNGILWSAAGEKMMVAMSNSAELVKDRFDDIDVPSQPFGENGTLESNEAVVSSDGTTAKFSLTATESCAFPVGEGRYRFHSVYPASASCGLGNVSIWDWLVFVGTTPSGLGQYPSATSYDPNADVMLGISQQEYTTVTSGMEIPMVFDRLVTHGKITLTNIPAEMTNVTKAVITAPAGCTMAGIYYINVLDKEFDESAEYAKLNQNYVTLNYTSPKEDKGTKAAALPGEIVDGTFDLWFCTKPIEIPEGQPLTISLQNASGSVSRQIVAKEGGIKFEKNKLSTLTVSMKDAVYNPYKYEMSMTPDGETITTLNLPRTSGLTEFYIRTNAGDYVNFGESSFSNLVQIYPDWEYKNTDSRGWNIIKCYAIYKQNHSLSGTIDGSIGVEIVYDGTPTPNISSSISVKQSAGAGEIVIGDWTGDPVEMAGVLWYPCNLGFDLTHPFGKYYQWGRRDGQYPYCDDNTTKFAQPVYDENTGAIVGPVDGDTYYSAGRNWYNNSTDMPNFNWPETDDSPYLGMGNPCPAGWRVPTKAEWTALSKLISSSGCWSTVGLKEKIHGMASFEGKTSSGKAAVWDLWDDQTGAALEFCVAGNLTFSPDWEKYGQYFNDMGNELLERYDLRYANGNYCVADCSYNAYYEWYELSYMQFEAEYVTCEGTLPSNQRNEALVRPSQNEWYVARSVRCVKSIE